jgi:hypothetical protein
MIIWIASYPRSGNSLYRELLWQLCGIQSYSRHNDPEVRRDKMQDAIGHIDADLTPEVIDLLEQSEETHFIKTHHLEERNGNSIYIVRDGRDVMVSFAHFKKNIEEAIEPLDEILLRLCQSDSWQRNVFHWLEHGPKLGEFIRLKFEDMLIDPIGTFLWSLDQVGISAPIKGTPMTFDELHEKWPKFFQVGKVGRWRDEMPQNVQDVFLEHNHKAMELLGYKI